MKKDLEERRIQTTVRTKWLQEAEEEGLADLDAYIEKLKSTIDKKQLQYQQMLSIRDNLSNVITEAAALLKEIQEAITQQKDLKIFPSRIEEFLEKNKNVIL